MTRPWYHLRMTEKPAYRAAVIAQLCAVLPGRNLYDVAAEQAVTVTKAGKLNKGWVGQAIERVAHLDAGNAARRDGADFELKSTSLVPRDGSWQPKETIKITQLNPRTILEEEFETSVLWNKLERLVVVGYHLEPQRCSVIRISAVDLADHDLKETVRAFWQDVRHTLCAGEIADHHNLGTSQDYIQLRPTGTGKQWSTCPITGERFPARAFYATKRLIKKILAAPT